jgi:hypothetical protein
MQAREKMEEESDTGAKKCVTVKGSMYAAAKEEGQTAGRRKNGTER